MTDYSYWTRLVLHKLKRLTLSGALKVEDGVRYIYEWDESKITEENLENVRKEDRALLYLIQIKAIEADHDPNEYRKQQLKGNENDINIGVWADWETSDPARREYGYEVEIYGVYPDVFEKELEKFDLMDAGDKLAELKNTSLPAVIQTFGNYTAHKDGSSSFQNSLIKLKPTARRFVHALIHKQGRALTYQEIIDILWNDELGTQGYLESELRNVRSIKKRINNLANEANTLLYNYGNKKHIVSIGGTGYKLVS